VTVSATAPPGLRRVEHIMGMPIVVDVRDDGDHGPVVDRMFDWLRWVDETFSTYKEGSEISRLARGDLTLVGTCEEVREVLARCEELRVETGGYFDAWAAGSLDPSGLVKGWSVERAAAMLAKAGLENFAVNAGGDIRLRGGAVPEPAWRVGIQHPLQRVQVAAVLEVTDLAIATSGAYARGAHVLDPHTGQAPRGVLSVTITGPELATADAYATAAFAMGLDGPVWSARLRGHEAMTILESGRVLTTPGFPSV
jgi:thiamine biosynthesis lipoprotein